MDPIAEPSKEQIPFEVLSLPGRDIKNIILYPWEENVRTVADFLVNERHSLALLLCGLFICFLFFPVANSELEQWGWQNWFVGLFVL